MPLGQRYSPEKLVQAIQNSDTEAFKQLYYQYFENLYRFLCKKIFDTDIAKDLVQELFLRVWRNRNHLDPKKSIKAYLYKTANNLAIDHLRREITRDNYKKQANPDSFVEIDKNIELGQEINQQLGKLADDQRTIIILNRLEGFKYAEIAEILDISVKTVEKKMSLALKSLRESLKHLLVLILIAKILHYCVGFFLFHTY